MAEKTVKRKQAPKPGVADATADDTNVLSDESLWTKRDIARYLQVDVRTVERMAIPRIPIVLVDGQRPIVRYDPVQVRAWIDARRTRKLAV